MSKELIKITKKTIVFSKKLKKMIRKKTFLRDKAKNSKENPYFKCYSVKTKSIQNINLKSRSATDNLRPS